MEARNPHAAKRIMSELRELRRETAAEFHAVPLESNLFEWHFTLRGPEESEYAGGAYHGHIILPSEYPFRPPHVQFATPNGRWEIDTKVRNG